MSSTQTGASHQARVRPAARSFCAAALAGVIFTCAPAWAQTASSASAATSDADRERARLLGLLVHTQVTISFDAMPARDAIDLFRQASGIPIVARWRDDAVGFGLEPGTLISIAASGRPAVDVLEEILEQCEVVEDCTWQLRKGFVEVGTKERLSVPAARETRIYDIRHNMIEAPTFGSPGHGSDTPVNLKYASAFTARRHAMVEQDNGEWVLRKTPAELADEIVTLVVETIEPGKWDVGQDRPRSRQDSDAPAGGSATTAAPASSAPPPAAATAQPRARTGVGAWATLRIWRDQLVIKAPDFMHRQINGYPAPIKPEGELARVADPNLKPGRDPRDAPAGLDETTRQPREPVPAPANDEGLPADSTAPPRPPGDTIKPPGDIPDGNKDPRPH
jgi:hypothetical protein